MSTTEPHVNISRSLDHLANRFLIYFALVALSAIFLLPIYLILTTSLKSSTEIDLERIWTLPQTFRLDSFTNALAVLGPHLLNSVLLTIPATAISAMMGSLNGYVLSKWRIPGANIIFPMMLFGMFIPYQSVLIPLFQLLRSLNLYGGLFGLILVHSVYGLPITTLIFRNYYSEVPTEMVEASQIDGADFFDIYRFIMFPLSVPGFVVVIIWQFTQIWNEYLFAVTLTNNTWSPITVALSQLQGGKAIDFSLSMAGSFLTAIPTLIVYVLLGRYFIRGLLAGSVKG